MTRPAIRRTAADHPAPGTTYSRAARQGRRVVILPPPDHRAPCLYRHAPDRRYVLGQHGNRLVWLCYRCLQVAPVVAAARGWRRAMARARAA